MNLLIIGGTGVLSSAVTAEALRKGIAVMMINRGKRRIPEGVELVKADKNDHQTIAKALEGRSFDAVMDFVITTILSKKIAKISNVVDGEIKEIEHVE